MSEIEYRIQHSKCKASFWPTETVRLYPDKWAKELGYDFIELMNGHCYCGEEVFGCIGLNYLLEPVRYEHIAQKKNDKWRVRKESDRVVALKTLLNPDKHTSIISHSVCGSVIDKLSGKVRYKENIPVV